jgi:hypothetical protein
VVLAVRRAMASAVPGRRRRDSPENRDEAIMLGEPDIFLTLRSRFAFDQPTSCRLRSNTT